MAIPSPISSWPVVFFVLSYSGVPLVWLIPASLLLVFIPFLLQEKPPAPKDLPRNYPLTADMQEKGKYDFVVVGAGSAGCVMTHFLVKAGFSVLLLEAGPEGQQHYLVKTPNLWWSSLFTWLDWDYFTVPQKNVNNREIAVNRGKVLGGCSTINACMWVKGCKQDYDWWKNSLGDEGEGWGYDELIPYFQSLEKYTQGDSKFRGKEGPLEINTPSEKSHTIENFLKAASANGHPIVPDYNDGVAMGCGPTQENNSDKRHNVFDAFVKPLLQDEQYAKKIAVVSSCHVTKLLFEEKKEKKCVGVEVFVENRKVSLHPEKEVILSAGTIGSAQLLMLSGIGPKEHLETLGISVRADLPVGENYHDHPFTSTVAELTVASDLSTQSSGFAGNLQFKSQYNKDQTEDLGPDMQGVGISGPFYCDALAQLTLVNRRPEEQLIGKVTRNIVAMTHQGLKRVLSDKLMNMMGIGLILNQPYSRGSMRLASKDPADKPLIDPQMFSDPRDLDRLVQSLEHLIKFWQTEPLKSNLKEVIEPKPHMCESREGLIQFIKKNSGLAWHPVGTCKMGAEKDKSAVVDSHLKVRGIKDLRVIDASIMPRVVSGNTHMSSCVIGARGAAWIIEDHKD